MKRLALAAASAAVLGLTGCGGHSAAPAAAPATHRAPVSCAQQYRSWSQGEGKGVMSALHGVSAAATSRNGQALGTALKQARPAVARAARHPMPACADPRGYLDVLLMHVNAAGASNASAAGKLAAVQDVPKIHRTLVAEVKQAAR